MSITWSKDNAGICHWKERGIRTPPVGSGLPKAVAVAPPDEKSSCPDFAHHCPPRKSWCHAPQRLPHRPTLVRLAALVTCAVPVLPWRPARCFRVLPSWHPFCFLLCLIHASRTNGWNAHVTHPTGAGGSQARGTGKFQSTDSKGVRRKGFRRARP